MKQATRHPTSPPPGATIGEVCRWQAVQRPNQRAFVFLDRGEREAESLTFAELDARAEVIARALHDRGLAGQRVLLAYPSCLEFVAALFGCFYAGAIAVPSPLASRGYAAERLQGIFVDSGAAAILTLRSLCTDGSEARTESPFGSLPCGVHLATDALAHDDNPAPATQPTLADVTLLQYTSGSTGNPRGVVLTHANLISNLQAIAAALRSLPEERLVHWLPLYHDMGVIGGVLYPVYTGLTVYLMTPMAFLQKPIRWLQAIHRYRATTTVSPGFAFRYCAERGIADNEAPLDLTSWRIAVCGAEVIQPEWLEQFARTFRSAGFDRRVFMPAYGLAEATLMATASLDGIRVATLPGVLAGGGDGVACEAPVRNLISCGRAALGQRLAIVDPATCRRVREGLVGEIWLQGSGVAAGYWKRPDETHATFQATLTDESGSGHWLRTGDLGFLGPDGLVVTGRAKETIIIRGVNYDPQDIESAAQQAHASLASGGGGAFSVQSLDGEAVVLVNEVKRTALRNLDAEIVAGTVVEVISRRFGLTLYDLVLLRPGTIPRTTSGKIRRGECRRTYLAGELASLSVIDLPILGRSRMLARSRP